MHDQHARHDRHIRTTIPTDWSTRLAHAAADLGLHRHEVVREAILLLLHRVGLGEGLRQPNLPESEVAP